MGGTCEEDVSTCEEDDADGRGNEGCSNVVECRSTAVIIRFFFFHTKLLL